jgi:Na+-driven multidrug efflux pump
VECVLNFRKYYEKSLLKEMTSFAGWSLLGSSTSMGAFYGQTLVINFFFGTVVNAAQGIAAQISGQLGAFALTMSKALNPVIGKSEGAGNRERTLRATLLGTKISFFLLGIFYLPFIIEMPYILHLWLKNVPEYTVIFCNLLLFRNLIEQLFIPLSEAITAVGNIKDFQKISAILNVTPIVAAFIFFSVGLPAYSIYIAFILFSVVQFFNVIHFAKLNCSLIPSLFYKEIASKSVLVFILSIIIGFIPNILMNESLFRLFIVIAIGGLSYLIFMWFIGLEEDERNMISNLKKSVVLKIKRNN